MKDTNSPFIRSEWMLGSDALHKLSKAKVAVFGLGGVGSYAVEALARTGVGNLLLVDADVIDISNINRQIYALHSTIGRPKVDVALERVKDINPSIRVETRQIFFLPGCEEDLLGGCDYIVDAIDTVTAKIELAQKAFNSGMKIISCMGTGNKLYPQRFKIADIFDTSVCPICRVMRYELKKRGITALKTLYSDEKPIQPREDEGQPPRTPASVAFVPSIAGLMIAGEVIRDLINL